MNDKITSARDFGYQFAAQDDAGIMSALQAPDYIPGFPDAVPEGGWDDFNAGCIQRKNDITPPVLYVREGPDHYTPLAEGEKPKKGQDVLRASIDWAMNAYSSQQAGALGKHQPNLKAIVMPLRKAASQYASNKRSRLRSAYKVATSTPTQRAPNLAFSAWLDKECESITKKAKRAKLQNEPDAPADMKALREMIVTRIK